MNPLREKVLEIARAEVGVREEPRGSNWGPVVQMYLKSVGIMSPAPWCAAFVFWVFKQALKAANPLPFTGYTPLVLQWAKQEKRVITAAAAQPADLVLFYFPSLKRVAHVGIVGVVNRPKTILWTIEGNTNDEGSREGYEVARRKRILTGNEFFVRMFPEAK